MISKKKKEKVYCEECEFNEFIISYVRCYWKCNHDNAIIGDWRERNAGRIEPRERNKNNDCADFKELKEKK